MQSENISTATLHSSTEKFEKTLQHYAAPLFESLADGLEKDYLDTILGRANVVERELNHLYSWKNGTKEGLALHILDYNQFSFGKMLPFGFAVSVFMANKAKPFWSKQLFPIVSTNAGEYLLYDTNKKSKAYRTVLLYAPSLLITKPEPIYDSLCHLFETVSECYTTGIYQFDPTTNRLEIDDQAEFLLSTTRNPKSTYWQE